MPTFRIGDVIVPATANPLGVKGAGGAGPHMDMPATPEKMWKDCRQA
jgi:hypothetical protein